MKKILLILFFAISFSSTAQQSEMPTEAQNKANSDVSAINAVNDLNGTGTLVYDLYLLFIKKHEDLAVPTLTDAEKQAIYDGVDLRLHEFFPGERIFAIQSDPVLYDRLIKG
jgi:hypothetical protein